MKTIPLIKHNIVINEGFLEVDKALPPAYFAFNDGNEKKFHTKEQDDKYLIEAQAKDLSFIININDLAKLRIDLGHGAILVNAITTKYFINNVGIGAIEMRIAKEKVGEIYMKVTKGTIIADNPEVILTQLYSGGFEGFYQGELKGQSTELIVGSGVILLKLY